MSTTIPVIRETPDCKESLQRATSNVHLVGGLLLATLGVGCFGNVISHNAQAAERAEKAYVLVQKDAVVTPYSQLLSTAEAKVDRYGSTLRASYAPSGIDSILSPLTKQITYYDAPPLGSIDLVETVDRYGNVFEERYTPDSPASMRQRRDYSVLLEAAVEKK